MPLEPTAPDGARLNSARREATAHEPTARSGTSLSGTRRIAAIFLPELLLEARGLPRRSRPCGVVLLPENSSPESSLPQTACSPNTTQERSSSGQKQLESSDRLSAVCPRARRLGITAGQTIVEATALSAGLEVLAVSRSELNELLLAVAEAVRDLAVTVALDANAGDTVWLDVTGIAPLFGGEDALAFEIRERVRLLGHLNRVVIASGPRIAQALARHGPLSSRGIQVIPNAQTAFALRELPLCALPFSRELLGWFTQLGLLTIADLLQLPASSASARLGPQAQKILDLAAGRDDFPLIPCVFPRHLEQKMEWEEPADGLSPLLFALRGLTGKISARLSGRGESATRLELELLHDVGIARHRGVARHSELEFDLSSPLQSQQDLERIVRSRLSRTRLPAPTIGMILRARGLTSQVMHQLEFGQGSALSLTELPVLLAELQAEIGKERVGLLQCVDSHLPEAKSILVQVPPQGKGPRRARRSSPREPARASAKPRRTPLDLATRFLPRPIPIQTPLQVGAGLVVGNVFYTIEKLRFVQRLEAVEWWTSHSTHRDYLWAWLQSAQGGTEALLFVDKRDGSRFVQALAD